MQGKDYYRLRNSCVLCTWLQVPPGLSSHQYHVLLVRTLTQVQHEYSMLTRIKVANYKVQNYLRTKLQKRYLGRSHPWKGFSCAEIEEVLGFCFHMHVLNTTICRPTSVPVPKGSTNWLGDACWAGQCPTPVHSTSAPSCKHFSHTSSHFHHQSLAFLFFFSAGIAQDLNLLSKIT